MAKEGSVAPKERVNIVYRPAVGDAKEEVELPLKLLIMGKFSTAEDDRPVEERDPVNIDKNNFDDVLKAQKIDLNVNVENKLTEKKGEEMDISLRFNSIKDFSPDAIARNVPELNKLLELREALTGLKGPLSNRPEFRKKIQELVKDKSLIDKLLQELDNNK